MLPSVTFTSPPNGRMTISDFEPVFAGTHPDVNNIAAIINGVNGTLIVFAFLQI
jgi:hypothetical protein